jgi:hypothetical protein
MKPIVNLIQERLGIKFGDRSDVPRPVLRRIHVAF